jgi:hypothetical protein
MRLAHLSADMCGALAAYLSSGDVDRLERLAPHTTTTRAIVRCLHRRYTCTPPSPKTVRAALRGGAHFRIRPLAWSTAEFVRRAGDDWRPALTALGTGARFLEVRFQWRAPALDAGIAEPYRPATTLTVTAHASAAVSLTALVHESPAYAVARDFVRLRELAALRRAWPPEPRRTGHYLLHWDFRGAADRQAALLATIALAADADRALLPLDDADDGDAWRAPSAVVALCGALRATRGAGFPLHGVARSPRAVRGWRDALPPALGVHVALAD